MKLVRISDIHVHRTPILGSDPIQRFSQVLDHIAEFHADADRLVITGNLTHQGHEADYRLLALHGGGAHGRDSLPRCQQHG